MRLSKKYKKFIEDPGLLISIFKGLIFKLLLISNNKVSLGRNVTVIDSIIIDLRKNAKLNLGKNILIRSRNRGYHGSMNTRTKIMIDSNGLISIGSDTRLYGCCIHASKLITIGERCLIASNVQIFDRNGHDVSLSNPSDRIKTFGKSKSIIIGNDVWLGTNCVILPGTIIGDGSVVMANSVVKGSFPNQSIIAGVPARAIKRPS